MKRAELLKRLRRIARAGGAELELLRHGGNHDQYRIGGTLIPVPRHREVNERLANAIIADAQAALKGAGQ